MIANFLLLGLISDIFADFEFIYENLHHSNLSFDTSLEYHNRLRENLDKYLEGFNFKFVPLSEKVPL
jgi:hypothetical protein